MEGITQKGMDPRNLEVLQKIADGKNPRLSLSPEMRQILEQSKGALQELPTDVAEIKGVTKIAETAAAQVAEHSNGLKKIGAELVELLKKVK